MVPNDVPQFARLEIEYEYNVFVIPYLFQILMTGEENSPIGSILTVFINFANTFF